MKYLYSETVNSLIEPVQKVIAYRERDLEPYDYHKLTGVKTILQEWKKNKNRFYFDFFDGHCVAEIGEVSVELHVKQKINLATEFIAKLREDWEEMFPGYEDYCGEAQELADFLELNTGNFFDNKTWQDYYAPDGTIIAENTKISKSFKHFFDRKELVRMVQDKFSAVIQQDKMTGILCASVHPLDFLSSSENNYKWRSCHALNGEYANGNLSYMMDHCTIIFYLKGADDVKLPRFPEDVPWNDKKWRMLVFMDQENRIIWAGRQYPFSSDILLNCALDFLRTVTGENYPNWTSKYVQEFEGEPLNESYIFHYGYLIPKKLLINDAKWSTHYNDLLYSSCYTPLYTLHQGISMSSTDLPKIKVGHSPICPCCGETKKILSNVFICKECEDVLNPPVCEFCRKQLNSSRDLTYTRDYGCICPDCLRNLVCRCEKCGNYYRASLPKCNWCSQITLSADLSYEPVMATEEITRMTEQNLGTIREMEALASAIESTEELYNTSNDERIRALLERLTHFVNLEPEVMSRPPNIEMLQVDTSGIDTTI